MCRWVARRSSPRSRAPAVAMRRDTPRLARGRPPDARPRVVGLVVVGRGRKISRPAYRRGSCARRGMSPAPASQPRSDPIAAASRGWSRRRGRESQSAHARRVDPARARARRRRAGDVGESGVRRAVRSSRRSGRSFGRCASGSMRRGCRRSCRSTVALRMKMRRWLRAMVRTASCRVAGCSGILSSVRRTRSRRSAGQRRGGLWREGDGRRRTGTPFHGVVAARLTPPNSA